MDECIGSVGGFCGGHVITAKAGVGNVLIFG